jgi:hypothetical protein
VSVPSLYEAAMGVRYTQLPLAVQRFHRLQGRVRLLGAVETEAPSSWPARLLASLLGTPRRSERGAIQFELEAHPAAERWTRQFPSRTMRSHFRRVGPCIEERLGPVRLRFELLATEGTLRMKLVRLHAFTLPCPRCLMPRILADESGEGDRLHFHVQAALPLIGQVAAYRGHLMLPPEPASQDHP